MKTHTAGGKTTVILGGGIGGVVAANDLRRKLERRHRVILIDRNDQHVYAPSFLWLMLGKRQQHSIQKPLHLLMRKGIDVVNAEITGIDPGGKTVKTARGVFDYDYLVISLGAELAAEKVPGLAESGYNLYMIQDVERLRHDLKDFPGGRVSIVVSSLPFKCPAAPYEAAFLLDEYFKRRGIRAQTEISVLTPEPFPMPAAGPENGKAIRAMLEGRNIKYRPEVQLASVDARKRELRFDGDIVESFDLLIFVPPHQGPGAIRDSNMGNEAGWIPVDRETFSTRFDGVFAIGDCAAVTLDSGKPLPKAGVFAHSEAHIVTDNIAAEIKGLPQDKKYDGQAYCFLETGYGKAGFAGGNFYSRPAPAIKMRPPGRIWYLGKILLEKYWMWRWF